MTPHRFLRKFFKTRPFNFKLHTHYLKHFFLSSFWTNLKNFNIFLALIITNRDLQAVPQYR